MVTYDRDHVEGQSYQISERPLDLSFFAKLAASPKPFSDGRQIPWNDVDFSQRMLTVHLDESHDWASRRAEKRERIIDALMGLTGLEPGDSVLDLGCGPGLYCQELARRGLRVEGWDYAPAAIEYARERSKATDMKIRYVRQDYRNLDVTERFDLVTLIYGDLNVFSRSDAVALLRRVCHALRPGGFFYTDVTTPAAHPTREITQSYGYHSSGLWADEPYLELVEAHPVDADGLRWQRYVIIETVTGRAQVYTTWSQEYTTETITALLEEAGFVVSALYDDPTESPLCDEMGWIGVLAQKPS